MVEVEVAGGFENPSSLENDFLVIDIPFFPSSIGEPFYVLTYILANINFPSIYFHTRKKVKWAVLMSSVEDFNTKSV